MTPLNSQSPRWSLRRSSPALSFDDAVEVWKRHFLGEKQHHIAQAFGVNQGRICEILNERRHIGSRLVAMGTNPISQSGSSIQ
jgi:hypothetical protein